MNKINILRDSLKNGNTQIGFRKLGNSNARWAFRVKIRDNFTCRNCNRKPHEKDLQAHHILSKSEYPHWRTELDNGVSLCLECHNLADKGIIPFDKFLKL